LIEHPKLDRFWTVERHIFRGRFLDPGGQMSRFDPFWHLLALFGTLFSGVRGGRLGPKMEDGNWKMEAGEPRFLYQAEG